MKLTLWSLLAAVLAASSIPLTSAPVSSGNYRIPYTGTTRLTVLADHTTHNPPDKLDLQAWSPTTPTPQFQVAAAANGIVRFIQDSNVNNCTNCPTSNNYVWIEHGNGEWSGYFNLQTGSATGNAGITVGDNVTAGQFIGLEGNVGAGGANRLHFEVGVPDDESDPIFLSTGFLKGENRVPMICNIPDNMLLVGNNYRAADCEAFEFSYGVYRLPYTNNVLVRFNQTHLTHAPVRNRLDLAGTAGSAPYPIVSAAAGTIMAIVDTNSITCTTNGCSAFNNYVWIAHANGEWTKYTHFQTGTVLGNAGLTVGQWVPAGTYLGDEGAVGAATGPHLHFEVAVPDDPSNINTAVQTSGGFVIGRNRIPRFCDIPGNIGDQGQSYIAGPCSPRNCDPEITLPAGTIRSTDAYMVSDTVDTGGNSIRVDTFGSLMMQAGNKITLRPGFRSVINSYTRAAIANCNNAP